MSAMMGRHSAVEPVQVVRRTSMTARSSASVGESMPAQQQHPSARTLANTVHSTSKNDKRSLILIPLATGEMEERGVGV